MKESPRWRFPKNAKAARNSEVRQAVKCREEASELFDAVCCDESAMRVCEEAWDCIQACEGILRKHPYVSAIAHARTVIKCWRRGDYED